MDSSDMGDFGGGQIRAAPAEVYTADYRVTGTIQTRLHRVADILNQLSSTHLVIEDAVVTEYGATEGQPAPRVLVAIPQILVFVGDESEAPEVMPEMRIPKRAISVEIALPPLRLTGTMHVPHGSRPADGLLNTSDRYLPMTDAAIGSLRYLELARTVPALALQRDRAHLIVIAEDETADLLDEPGAAGMLHAPGGGAGAGGTFG